MEIRTVALDHPDALKLITEVQQEYVVRYGSPDRTPVDPAEFTEPAGLFLIGYLGDSPVACGGWRSHDGPQPEFQVGDAEMKRLYVSADARGRGYARTMLARLEETAREAGRVRMVLETGTRQPEAIELYQSSGYDFIPKFGVYRCDPESVCMGRSLVD